MISAPEVLVDGLFPLPAGNDLAVVPPVELALPLEPTQPLPQYVKVLLVFVGVTTEYSQWLVGCVAIFLSQLVRSKIRRLAILIHPSLYYLVKCLPVYGIDVSTDTGEGHATSSSL